MPESPLTPSALSAVPEVRHDRAQTIGLSSCPEDEHGNECELCAEQVDRLIERVRDAVLAAERTRLVSMTSEQVVEAAAKEYWEKGYPHGHPWSDITNRYEGRQLVKRLRAAAPILLAGERAESWKLIDKMSAAKLAAESARDRYREALEGLVASIHNNGPMGAFASEALVKARAALKEAP